ncbi:Glycosyl transferase family 2 [Hymenobacter gelipurpurascens]|uniref:Glycosyl transferase family 2 n=1 Tax=Hymenobacter gelipurpurascens TaxID=89968 RepID=A0A212UH94_9BACT|nr:glycosyltransferase [Hymenobacter gelipurpurascens]SNC77531.1 Glycosyl transferase family 2 [Hymenobacter gelipurpurascens]
MALLISIILPVYNQERCLAETLDSVLGQQYQNFELLLHDDGSTDNSAAIIRRYAAQDPRIRATFAANAGRPTSTNLLVSQAQGKWCVFLDADDVMLPERLARQLAYHLEHPEVDASSCHCYYINEQGQRLGIQRYPGLRTAEEGRRALAKGEFVQCAFTGLFIKKEVYLANGGLDSQFWPCDDFEFFNRLVEQGYSLVILPEPLMLYRIHSTSASMSRPLFMYDKTGHIMDCVRRRITGQPPLTFAEFMAERQRHPWWMKVNRRRYNYAQIFFRNAAIAIMSKKYVDFGWQILVSALLSPNHLLLKFRGLSGR